MWNVEPTSLWDWEDLKRRVAEHGVRNSLLLAPMPTASTAQILGNNESFEPYTTNIYTRRVLSGEFQVRKEISFFGEHCCRSLQICLSISNLKMQKLKTYKTVIFLLFCM
jgi:hypothetical protein